MSTITQEEFYSKTAFQQRLAQIGAAAEARQAATVGPLRQRLQQLVAPALFASREQAAAEVQQARADLAAAEGAHRRHVASPPSDRGAVATWVQERTRLAGEVDGYRALLGQAEAAYRAAEQALGAAMRAAFAAEHQQRLVAWQEQRQASAAEAARIEQEAKAAIEAEGQKIAEVRAPLDAWRQLAAELGVSLPALPGEEGWRGAR